jgi:hypothetical protein
MKYPVISESGANFHMFNDKAFFVSILPVKGQVLLGDGKTFLPIKGIGSVKCYTIEDRTINMAKPSY